MDSRRFFMRIVGRWWLWLALATVSILVEGESSTLLNPVSFIARESFLGLLMLWALALIVFVLAKFSEA